MSLFHPKDWIRMYELHKLEQQVTRLQSYNVPVPPWLTQKIADLRASLAGSG